MGRREGTQVEEGATVRLDVEARIDTLGLSFPIVDADENGATVTVLGAGTPEQAATFRRKLPGGGFLAWGMSGTAWVEASLPKRLGDDNVDGLVLDEALSAAEALFNEATAYVQPGVEGERVEDLTAGQLDPEVMVWHKQRVDPDTGEVLRERRLGLVPRPPLRRPVRPVRFEECSVKRLDLVRDFDGVTAIGPLLDGLATVRQRGGHKVRRYADGEAQRAETLRVGPRTSWSCKLYDKHVESGSALVLRRWVEANLRRRRAGLPELPRPTLAAEPGRLRFEALLRAETFAQKGMREVLGTTVQRVADLEEKTLRKATRVMFERVGFDREVSGVAQVGERINALEGVTPRTKRELTAYLMATAAGIDLAWSRNTERKYRDLAAQLGLVVTPGSLGEAFTASLDFDAGTERVTVAA